MKTSTPTNLMPTRKHSLNRNFLTIEDNDEIEADIQRRREEAINKSAEVRRKSIVAPLITGLTGSQLTQHCRDCIKLSTENKINAKNAFSLLLIDVMAAMAKKADSEISKNFQVAGCTLDASVKIYGYRVDAIHSEAMKMAYGVLSKEAGNNVEQNEDLKEGKDEAENKAKLKKKRKKKLTVVHPDTLNSKSETDPAMDITPHQSFLLHKTDGNNLLVEIPKLNDNNILYINSEYLCWPFSCNATKVPPFKDIEVFDSSSLKEMLKEVQISKNNHLCSLYQNFEFEKDIDQSDDDTAEEEYSTPSKRTKFEFDLNASIEDTLMSDEIIATETDTQRNRLQIPVGGYDSDQEIQMPPSPPNRPVKNIPLADLKNRITFNQLEYSMFDEQVIKFWAGPSYWKVGQAKKICYEEKENELKAVGSRSVRKAKAKNYSGLFDISENLVVKYLMVNDKRILNKSTMLNWSAENVTVPKDSMYKLKNFFTLYHYPNLFLNLKSEFETNQLDLPEAQVMGNKSDAKEELQYCSNVSFQDNCQQEEEYESDFVCEKNEVWDDNNMVSVPNKVEKIQVSNFRRKKNVDIKYLKNCLWNMLVEDSKSETERRINRPVTFNEIMTSYKTKMPYSLVPCLNAPQIFNALLHLTNEKCLCLTQDKLKKSDFVVYQ